MITCGLLALVSALVPIADNRVWFGRIEVEGPSAGFIVRQADGGTTRLLGELLPGETRVLEVPLSREPLGGADAALVIEALSPDRGGAARWVGWAASQPESRWERLPRGIRARPRPPGADPFGRLGPAVMTGLLLAFVSTVLVSKRRPALAVAAAALFGIAAGVIPIRQSGVSESVWELTGSAAEGLEVRVSAGELEFDGSRVARIETSILGATLHFGVPMAPVAGGALDGSALCSVRAERGGVISAAPRTSAGFALEREKSAGPSLDQAWTRDPAGRWIARGPWRRGQPLPDPVPGSAAPPAWLAGGLPQGVFVLLGRFEGGPESGWLRWTEFP